MCGHSCSATAADLRLPAPPPYPQTQGFGQWELLPAGAKLNPDGSAWGIPLRFAVSCARCACCDYIAMCGVGILLRLSRICGLTPAACCPFEPSQATSKHAHPLAANQTLTH